jgi:hypothetical protein
MQMTDKVLEHLIEWLSLIKVITVGGFIVCSTAVFVYLAFLPHKKCPECQGRLPKIRSLRKLFSKDVGIVCPKCGRRYTCSLTGRIHAAG